MKRGILLVMACVVFASSCAMTSMVTINTSPNAALVFIDGQPVGESPVTVQMSNAFWDDPVVMVRKDGYRDLRTSVTKEVKMINLISGILLVWPSLLWVYGPEEYQHFMLTEE